MLGLVGLLLLAVAGLGIYGYVWVSNYVQSDAFRVMLSRELGEATRSRAEIDDLSITGPFVHVSAARMRPIKRTGWSMVEADRVEAQVSLDRLRQRVVEVESVLVDKAVLQMSGEGDRLGELPLELDQAVESSNVPEWLKRFLPNRTVIGSITAEDFDLRPAKAGGVSIEGLHLTGTPVEGGKGEWQLRGRNGMLRIPASEVPFRFDSATANVGKSGLVLHDSMGKWIGDAEVTSRGELPFGEGGEWRFEGTYRDLEVRSFLSDRMRQHVSGTLAGDYDVNAERFHTEVEMTGGLVQNLPLLERVADFTRTEQFKRLVLDEAKAEVTRRGELIQMRNVVLHSKGLVRVEGDIDVEGQQLRGDLYVGVTTGALRWIPGSQSRVFTEERRGSEPGFVWTRVQLSGTIGAPKEDLSNRLLAAMGKALILDAPLGAAGVGVDILKGTGEVAGDAAKGTVETGAGVIEGAGKAAGKAVETGADLLKKVIPGF
ncbi:hypothetical protein FEM03_08305 [Phragmitibacter flavus]|uniref:AsmA-like C-terminal domain-containing protein n=1 Tax=Phragmitibacter flavus TaxID=2576071 RepID=A0A5R8KHR1_9BACT|nr:hypothetical protein FEM03_08305 [Phragmitibacter flavus]